MDEPPIGRQVLECASPLALSIDRPAPDKRRRTGALEDAVALSNARLVHGSNVFAKADGGSLSTDTAELEELADATQIFNFQFSICNFPIRFNATWPFPFNSFNPLN